MTLEVWFVFTGQIHKHQELLWKVTALIIKGFCESTFRASGRTNIFYSHIWNAPRQLF